MVWIYSIAIVVVFVICTGGASAVPIRASIDNATLPYFINITSSVSLYGQGSSPSVITTTSIPPIYGLSVGQIYPTNGTGHSARNTKRSISYPNTTVHGLICGTVDQLITSGSTYYSFLVCYTFNETCSGVGITTTSILNANIGQALVTAVPPRILLSSQSPTALVPLSATNAFISVYISSGFFSGGDGIVYFFKLHNINTTLGYFGSSTTGVTHNGQIPFMPFMDYDIGGAGMFYTYYTPPGSTQLLAQSVVPPLTITEKIITGYNLLNHYTYAEGLNITLPVFIIANTSHIILAVPVSNDLTLASGLLIKSAAPIVGCYPDQGTIINWNNAANPYPNTVHLYTQCNFRENAGVPTANSSVYEINVVGLNLQFSRWQTTNFATSYELQAIGEYKQILVTISSAIGPSSFYNVFNITTYYSLYDPYNPVLFGTSTISSSVNPIGTFNPKDFSIASDVSITGCSGLGGKYLLDLWNNGITMATIGFCGSGNPQYNNLTYCDGPGECCGNFCQYAGTCSSGTNVTACRLGECIAGDVNCHPQTAPNGTWCAGTPGICYNNTNSTCFEGVCEPPAFLPNATIITNGTVCQTPAYCDGAGHLIPQVFLPATFVCNSGNASYCVLPSNCTGNNATCPANRFQPDNTTCGISLGICYNNNTCLNGTCVIGSMLPNGTLCGINQGVCYNNNTCEGGVCQLGAPLPNGTIITPATVCQLASYCNGAGVLVIGAFLPSTTLCRAGNFSYCLEDANCTGSSAICPANQQTPDGQSCSNVTACGLPQNICASGSCVINPNGNCSALYPCANYTTCLPMCTPVGFKPYGTICQPDAVTFDGICLIPGGFCTGSDTQCIGASVSPNGTNCTVRVSANCNQSGTCMSGNCVALQPCNNTFRMFSLEFGKSFDPPILAIVLISVLVGMFVICIVITIFDIIRRRRKIY